MKFVFSPVRRDETLVLERQGDTLIVNGQPHDFSNLAEGASLSVAEIGDPWFSGNVTRQSGEIEVQILLPHGVKAPQQTLFPDPITVTADGVIDIPPHGETPWPPQPLEP